MLPAVPPIDTDPTVASILRDRWRSMSVTERAALTQQLCGDVDRIARAGILAWHPHASEAEIAKELTRRRYGDALASEAYGLAAARLRRLRGDARTRLHVTTARPWERVSSTSTPTSRASGPSPR